MDTAKLSRYQWSEILFGIIFLLIGLYLFVFASSNSLQCHRFQSTEMTCQLILSNTLKSEVRDFSAGKLLGAELRDHGSRFGPIYQVVILSDNDKIAFNTMGNRRKQQRVADQINTFLNDTNQVSLNVERDYRWLGHLLGVLCMLIGSGALLVTLFGWLSEWIAFIFGGIAALSGIVVLAVMFLSFLFLHL